MLPITVFPGNDRMRRNLTITATAFVALLWAVGLGGQARATEVTLCPNAGTPAVYGTGTSPSDISDGAGPLDGTCGSNSAVTISVPHSTDEGKLQFNSSTPGYPTGLALGGLLGLSANVSFTSHGSDQPFYMLAFTDPSKSLGQNASSDQILLLEFQSSALTNSGSTLAMSPDTTLFNLYDNTTGSYLQGGQHDTNTLAGWLTDFPVLEFETLQGIWIGEGLTGSDTGPDSLTINSLDVTYTPEPASISLITVALIGLGAGRRRKRDC